MRALILSIVGTFVYLGSLTWLVTFSLAWSNRGGIRGYLSPPPPPPVIVTIGNDFKFHPSQVSAPLGGTVLWRNEAFDLHTVTADPAKAADPAKHVLLPEGAQTWDSGLIKPDATFSHQFKVPGKYRYFCIPHEATGMVGEVIVGKE